MALVEVDQISWNGHPAKMITKRLSCSSEPFPNGFNLTIDGCALLSKTSADVLATLTKQLDTFQLLGGNDCRIRSMEQSMNLVTMD